MLIAFENIPCEAMNVFEILMAPSLIFFFAIISFWHCENIFHTELSYQIG